MMEFILFTVVMCLPIAMVIIFDVLQTKQIDNMRNEVSKELNLLNNRVDVLHALMYKGNGKSKNKSKK